MSGVATPSSPGTAALAFAGVGMEFPGVRALDQVDFAVHEAETHAFLGENGAGKSTLLKAIGNGARIFSGQIERRPGLTLAWQQQQAASLVYSVYQQQEVRRRHDVLSYYIPGTTTCITTIRRTTSY